MPNASEIMTSPRPKFVTFDCYGTLICLERAPAARRVDGERLSPEAIYDRHITNKVFVNRGAEPPNPYSQHHEIKGIGGLAGLVGL
jgi:FMN phosphatase YigB (HAD superfamily)